MMNKKIKAILLIAFTVITNLSLAQTQQDSITLSKIDWDEVSIDKGILWKTSQVSNLLKSNQSINIIYFTPKKSKDQLAFFTSNRILENTSAIAKRNNAITAINGSYFNQDKATSTDLLKINGNTISLANQDTTQQKHTDGLITIDGKKVKLVKNNTLTKLDAPSIMAAGPMLITNGIYESLTDSIGVKISDYPDVYDRRNARSCIGETANGDILLVTIDGGNEKAAGMSITELAWFMKQLGCINAIYLNGGNSTTLYVKGEMDGGVVNYPFGNEKFNHEGEGKTATIIGIATKK